MYRGGTGQGGGFGAFGITMNNKIDSNSTLTQLDWLIRGLPEAYDDDSDMNGGFDDLAVYMFVYTYVSAYLYRCVDIYMYINGFVYDDDSDIDSGFDDLAVYMRMCVYIDILCLYILIYVYKYMDLCIYIYSYMDMNVFMLMMMILI
jgi:hypothetical protein